MRINSTGSVHASVNVGQSPPVQPPRSGQESAPAHRRDGVELSNDLKRMRRAQAAASEAPDVRAERVAEIKARIQSGAYHVDTDALAQKLLDHM